MEALSPDEFFLFRKASKALCLILILLSASIFNLDSQISPSRPQVGLALSGGGACGLAHIGVLKVMEEEGLKPDMITGVSMGSIIGGLYALGYSADTLEYMVKTADWNDIISSHISENKVIFEEKRHFMNSIISLPLNSRKVKLPSGLINGQQIENILSYHAWPAADINDFSKLPVPFACLATDIINNRKILLNRGYLPDAIRASIAVPSLLTPFTIDSLLLIDGGFIRNYAASELKDMGADIIIGSYTGFREHSADEIETITDVVKQIGLVGSLQDYQQQKKLTDILIEPDLTGCSPVRFTDADTLVLRGYRAAGIFRDKFRALADSFGRISRENEIENIFVRKLYSFDAIRITGNHLYSDELISGILDIDPGEPVGRDKLKEKIELLYGKSWFEKIRYRFEKREDSLTLVIDCSERSGKMLYGSVHYDNTLKAGAIIGLSLKELLFSRSMLDLNTFIGEYYRFSAGYIKYLDRLQKFNVALDVYADRNAAPALKGFSEIGGAYMRNFESGLSLNRLPGLNHMISIAGRFEMMDIEQIYDTDADLEKFTGNYLSGGISYQINSLNQKYFPDRGIEASFLVKSSKLISAYLWSDSISYSTGTKGGTPLNSESFLTIRGHFIQHYTQFRQWTFSAGLDLLYISDSDSLSSMNSSFFLGGAVPAGPRCIGMTGFHPYQIQVYKMAGVNLSIDYEAVEKVHFRMAASFSLFEDIYRSGKLSLAAGAGAEAAYSSVIGPVRLGVMYGIRDNEPIFKNLKGFISIGYNF